MLRGVKMVSAARGPPCDNSALRIARQCSGCSLYFSRADRAVGLRDRLCSPRLPAVSDAQRTAVVRVPGFLSDSEIENIHCAAAALREERGEASRSNGLDAATWKTVYFNHLLAERLPWLRSRLHATAREVDSQQRWGVLDGRRQLSFRCAEYHQVLPAGGLPIKEHYDAGSLITLDLMLSETGDFAGGVFATLEADGELKEHAFERGDLIVFVSHKYHCVSPVSRGLRRVLVAEIWEGVERRCPGRCHVPWGPCNCLLEPENLHVLRRDGPVQLTATPTFAYTPLADVPFSRSTPLLVKKAWTRMTFDAVRDVRLPPRRWREASRSPPKPKR